jgi:hypothetical protein
MKFYPADWLKGTRRLALAEKGALADALAYAAMNAHSRGTVSGSLAEWGRMLGCEGEETRRVLEALAAAGHADFSAGREAVSVAFSSLIREEAERKSDRERKTRCPEASRSAAFPANFRGRSQTSEVRSQKSEVRNGSSGQADPEPAGAPAGSDGGSGSENTARMTLAPRRAAARARGQDRKSVYCPGAIVAAAQAAEVPEGLALEVWLSGYDETRLVAWLLTVGKRAPHDAARGGAAAYFRSLWQHGKEPADWALAGAKDLLRKDAAELPERARKLIGEIGESLAGREG